MCYANSCFVPPYKDPQVHNLSLSGGVLARGPCGNYADSVDKPHMPAYLQVAGYRFQALCGGWPVYFRGCGPLLNLPLFMPRNLFVELGVATDWNFTRTLQPNPQWAEKTRS